MSIKVPIEVTVPGKVLVANSELKLVEGRKYGLMGANGSGKTTLLKMIAQREVEIPEYWDIRYINQDGTIVHEGNSTQTIFELVRSSNVKRMKLQAKLEELEQSGDYEEYNTIAEELSSTEDQRSRLSFIVWDSLKRISKAPI